MSFDYSLLFQSKLSPPENLERFTREPYLAQKIVRPIRLLTPTNPNNLDSYTWETMSADYFIYASREGYPDSEWLKEDYGIDVNAYLGVTLMRYDIGGRADDVLVLRAVVKWIGDHPGDIKFALNESVILLRRKGRLFLSSSTDRFKNEREEPLLSLPYEIADVN